MSEHAILAVIIIGGFTVQAVVLGMGLVMLRESQRLTRAVAGLVYQESDRIRALLGRG